MGDWYWFLTIFPIKIPNITLDDTQYWLILAPGVIQLTLLDGASIDRQIRQLARDPRYSTVLTMRPGVATRSSSDSATTQLIPRDPPQPATQISERPSQPAASENVGGDDRATPALPAIPVFSGSTTVDYTCSILGIRSRGHYRMLDSIVAPLDRQLRPVSHYFHY